MKRILLDIAYDGTNYCGWQFQPNGITVEEVLNRELSALLSEDVHVIGASRTDSGVHAWQNFAVFDTDTRIPPEKICFALNQRLPEDISVQASREVAPNWHPRKINSIKTYEYRILNRRIPFPPARFDAYFMYQPLDTEKMREAAAYLVGEHDFKSFCSVTTQAEETIRTIFSAEVLCEPYPARDDAGRLITIRLRGNGFLTHMVRIIAGTLMKIGTGQYPPEKIREMLAARDRYAAGPKAPAKGLTLVSFEEVFGLLPEEHVESPDWVYTITRAGDFPRAGEYAEARTGDVLPCGAYDARIRIERSADCCFERNIARLVKHAFQDRAARVLVTDDAGRLTEGIIGDYSFKKAGAEAGSSAIIFEAEDLHSRGQTAP